VEGGVPEQDPVRIGPLVEEVEIVLAGEADPAVGLDGSTSSPDAASPRSTARSTPSVGHHLRNAFDEDLVYLDGGERKEGVGGFPRLRKHMIRMIAAREIFLDNPLQGVRLSGFKTETGFLDYPYNLVLQIPCEGGRLTTLPFLPESVLMLRRWFCSAR
jgi:hypothetical protein